MSTLDDRRDILNAFLAHATFDGWTDRSLKAAARETGRDMADVALLFPRGIRDLLAFFSEEMDRAMVDEAAKLDLASMKIRERIATLVRLRLMAMERHREAARRASLTMALPLYADIGLKTLAATVDTIWRLAGDRATDWNYYSKRAILSGVYASTLLTWFSDQSEDHAETWAFLDRRIGDVMKIEKAKARCRETTKDMPSLARILGRLRHRDVIRPL
jgi:ubiquinone biosynthesis protein COQ9